jgi:hypothetical protein
MTIALTSHPMNALDVQFASIQSLYSKYCFSLDGGDGAVFGDCFTPDGIFQIEERQFHGRERIAQIAGSPRGIRPPHFHANLWVKRVEGTLAEAAAYFLVLDPGTGSVAGFGHYEDDLVRDEDDLWRFKHRRITFVWQTPSYKARADALKQA